MNKLQELSELILKANFPEHENPLEKWQQDPCQIVDDKAYVDDEYIEFIDNISPITLAMVLIALEKKFKNEYHKMIFQDEKLLFIYNDGGVSLSFTDLNEQDPEVIEQLLILMKGE